MGRRTRNQETRFREVRSLQAAKCLKDRHIGLDCILFITQKTSYKQLALKIHPDKNKDDPEAAEKFNKLTEAYKILTNEEKRSEYD